MHFRGLPGTGGSFRRPPAGCARDAIIVSTANERDVCGRRFLATERVAGTERPRPTIHIAPPLLGRRSTRGPSITRTRAPRHFPYIRRVRFSVRADEYDRFIGRYSVPLAPRFAEFAGVAAGQRVLDVGCGPGALTVELVRLLGAEAVRAVDPSENFVAAVRARHPGVQVQRAAAEQLPFDDELFDAALAQLVVHFMADPVVGLREMARVTTAGGVVAGCVWDHAGGQGPLSLFWKAARQLDPGVED